jgi:hypothetical protein
MKTVNEILAYVRELSHAERQRLISLLNLMYKVQKEEEFND